MPKREPKKCRQWERERRNRLKTQFNGLSKVLPSYDPSAPLSKCDILKGATSYIKELQTLNQKVINGDQSLHDDLKRDLQMLDTRIQKLLNRNEQLVALLQNAGIRIPTELKADKQFCKPKLWSNKITKEKADILAEQVNNVEKENEKTIDTTKKVKLKKTKTNNENKKVKTNKNKIKKTLKSKTLKVLHYNNNVKACLSTQSSSQVLNVTTYSIASSKSIVPYQPNSLQSQQSSIILNNPTITCKNAAVTNSTLLTTPIMATGITTDSRSISSLGPGTLILANGNVFPILPGATPATIIQQPTLLVANTAPATNQTLLVVGKPSQTNIIESVSKKNGAILKQYPRIAIKQPGITKTTTVNKVPIPALTSKFGRKVIGKENQKKSSINSKQSSSTGQNSDKQLLKRKGTTLKKCECAEKVSEDEPLKKVVKPSEKDDNNEEEASKETLKIDEVPEKKVPVSNYSVDSLCAKSKTDEDKKENDNQKTEISKQSNENNISPPVTSFLDIPPPLPTSIAGQTSTDSGTTVSKPSENLSLTLPPQNHDFSSDLFSTLNVPNGTGSHHHHPESISPTAAFLLAFPLVSTLTGGKTENADEENSESQNDPPTLLQIGNIENSKSDISFDNIPNFCTVKSKKLSETCKSKLKSKVSSANILDAINTNTLIPEIPAFQNHIFNYEHTPVTCNKNSKTSSFQQSLSNNNSTMEMNYSENIYLNSAPTVTSSTTTVDLQLSKTSTPYITKLTTNYNNREQFKYPSIPVTSSQKPLVNWMTTPATSIIDNPSFLPDFSSGVKTKYFKYIEEVGTSESRNFTEEQYPWTSSSTTSNVNIAPPSTLPMLMGDLALNTTTSSVHTFGVPNVEDYYSKKKQSFGTNKEQQGKHPIAKQQYENLPNNTFLSVSQLVDHNKSEQRTNKTSPRKVATTAPPSLKRSTKNEQKTVERFNCGVKESSFLDSTYQNNQNWIKQSTNHKNPAKTGQKTFVDTQYDTTQMWIKSDSSKNVSKSKDYASEIPYETQNWIKQSMDKNPPKNEKIEGYNCNPNKELPFVTHVSNATSSYGNQNWIKTDKNSSKNDQKDSSPFVSHVPNTSSSYETQNWIKTDKNPQKSEQKSVDYNKESPFVSHIPNASSAYETQNWIKTDKNPQKSDQKTVDYNKESPFVSHVTNTTSFENQNWIKTDKNSQKNDQKTVDYNKESPFVSHISNTSSSYETQNWIKTDKNPQKSDQKTVDYNKESPFISHVSNTTSYDTQWIKQDKNSSKSERKNVYASNNHVPEIPFETQNWIKHDKNSSKSEPKSVEGYNNCSSSKEGATYVSHVPEITYDHNINWIKQSTDSKNLSKNEQKSINYNCNTGNKESFITDPPFETQNWMKHSTDTNSKNVYKNQAKVEHKTMERYYNNQNESQNWMKNPTDNNKNVFKNCSSTYSAEALISGQSSTNYSYPTSKRGYVPTFDPIGIPQPFYNNEYSTQESTNYYSQNSNYQNFQFQEFDNDNYNTPSLFPNQIKACSKVKDNRKGNTTVPCSNPSLKRTNKRTKQVDPPSTGGGGIGTTTTTLPASNFQRSV